MLLETLRKLRGEVDAQAAREDDGRRRGELTPDERDRAIEECARALAKDRGWQLARARAYIVRMVEREEASQSET